MYETVLKRGLVVDGSGRDPIMADVAIRNHRIAKIGDLSQARAETVLDCMGLVVSPGFIDAHVHGDLALLADPDHPPAIHQGVTTYLCGQDGVAFAPGSQETQRYMRRYTAGFNGNFPTPGRTWNTIGEYLAQFDGTTALNVATLIPNGNVRMEVMGLENRVATAEELAQMRSIIREGMEQGAVGLSSGLDYIPSLYADEKELAELCKELVPFDGVYVTHMRGYTPANAPKALEEVFVIGRDSQCKLHVSHFNCLAKQTIPILDEMNGDDADITFDLYPYLYGSTTVAMLTLPPEMGDGGIDATLARLRDPACRQQLETAFENPRFPLATIRLSSCPHPDWTRYEGMLLKEAAGSASLVDFVCDLLIATDLAAGCVIRHFHERQEPDIQKLMRDHRMMAGSDGIFCGSKPHPRGTGSFARYLGHHVRIGDWKLQDAVKKCSRAVADRFGMKDRGRIQEGYWADLAVWNPRTLKDRSTLTDGQALAEGMKHVFVNGQAVLLHEQPTGKRPGVGIRRGR
ncbi:MAG: D-aminoacylase [Gemmataceae bacterium]